ncbi:hypothetical protein [Mycolicibacterium moriokaense]|uniref:hypothetical protein n=1 Tax=Mycolicibacterium moriokaense TaxID=39691 RepID=UPI0015E8ABBD|nr:hypothetical protein [Mycolicibacterium moriokaense]
MAVAAARATDAVVVTMATAGAAGVLMDADGPLLAITTSVATWSAAGVELVDVVDVWCSTLADAWPEFAAAVELAVWASEVCGAVDGDARRCEEGVFDFGDSACDSELLAARPVEVWASSRLAPCVDARASEVAAVWPSRFGTEAEPDDST